MTRAPTILCLGAHCDDIEIGCGGTLAHWAKRYPGARFVWAVFSGSAERAAETRAAARALLGGDCHCEIEQHEFRDSYFPDQFAAIKESLAALGTRVRPDVVLTHYERDRHQDHRVLAELAWNTFRNHPILEYEIPKYDGDLGSPNVFVPLPAGVAQRKAEALLASFPSQRGRDWFTADTFLALLRLRGIECKAPSGFAEAFYARKLVLGS
ncbi:MAG TPA: PIG-L deacetylase family protein [Steroidobacteraceae bacterium]|nr:PIG-L deacetylase family protein [Steroidobacteraceae bacterium]